MTLNGSRYQAHWFECVKNCNAFRVFHAQPFPRVLPRMVQPPEGHPANLTQLWEASESTWIWNIKGRHNTTQQTYYHLESIMGVFYILETVVH